MRKFQTQGIVLTRLDFGEADRILTFLTPDQGKVKAIAKAVRKQKSKLAGGIELFSISDLSVIVGRGEINTLASTRLVRHYGNIVKELARSDVAYDLMKITNKATEEVPEIGYFNLLKKSFESLDDKNLDPSLIRLWFEMQLLKLAGHAPNLNTNSRGAKLKASQSYNFHIEQMHFVAEPSGAGGFSTDHIKFLRLGFAAAGPSVLSRVQNYEKLRDSVQPLVRSMLLAFVRIGS